MQAQSYSIKKVLAFYACMMYHDFNLREDLWTDSPSGGSAGDFKRGNLLIICRRGVWLIFSVRCKEKEADEHGQKR